MRGRVATEMQHCAQLKVMLRKKEIEQVQVRTQKLTEKAEVGKKRERLESNSEENEVIVGTVFKKDSITWQTVTGRVCTHCTTVHQNCFWWDAKQARACYTCSRAK